MAEFALTQIVDYYSMDDVIGMLSGHLLNSIELGQATDLFNKSENILIFDTGSGKFGLMHDKSCCETVELTNFSYINDTKPIGSWTIKDVKIHSEKIKHTSGDVTEITNLILAIENDDNEYDVFSFSWFGRSNGYYSTGIDLYMINEKSEDEWDNYNIEVEGVIWKSWE